MVKKDIGNPRDWVEFEYSGTKLRTRRERTILADSIIGKIFFRDKALGAHDVIKADCEVYDMDIKEWREVHDSDLEKIGRKDGKDLFDEISELRKKEKDFHKTKS